MPPIDFRGYSGDCLVHGRLDIPTEARLTDFLNASLVITVHGTTIYALADGRPVQAGDQELVASEVWAVEPTDTGKTPWHADLKEVTRAIRIEIDMPPYRITGTLHRADPQGRIAKSKRRSRRMVPLTDAQVTFVYMGHEITRQAPVVIFNRERAIRIRRKDQVSTPSEAVEVLTPR